MDSSPSPPRGRWRARLDDGDVAALPVHVLQRVARVVYLAAAVALLVWVVREQVPRFDPRQLPFSVGLLMYAGSLGFTATRFRGTRTPSALFVPTLVLVVLHGLIGLSGSVCLAAYGSFSRAFEGVGGLPLVLCYFALLGGLLIAVLLFVTARRVAGYVGACGGIFLWLLAANVLFG